MADVGDDQGPGFVARQEMAPTRAAEGDRQIGASDAMHDPGFQIDAGRAVDRDDRHFEIEETLQEGCHRRTWRSRRASTEQRVDGEPDIRPGAVCRDLSHSLRESERADPLVEIAPLPRRASDPHWNAESMKRASQDPTVAAVVARDPP